MSTNDDAPNYHVGSVAHHKALSSTSSSTPSSHGKALSSTSSSTPLSHGKALSSTSSSTPLSHGKAPSSKASSTTSSHSKAPSSSSHGKGAPKSLTYHERDDRHSAVTPKSRHQDQDAMRDDAHHRSSAIKSSLRRLITVKIFHFSHL